MFLLFNPLELNIPMRELLFIGMVLLLGHTHSQEVLVLLKLGTKFEG